MHRTWLAVAAAFGLLADRSSPTCPPRPLMMAALASGQPVDDVINRWG